jgi:hypothetical protein
MTEKKTSTDRARKYYQNNPWMSFLKGARRRCTDENFDGYAYYGGRGITCELTKEQIFEIWMRDNAAGMSRPSLDRINSDENYTKDNCRFIELSENSSGRRNARDIAGDRRTKKKTQESKRLQSEAQKPANEHEVA